MGLEAEGLDIGLTSMVFFPPACPEQNKARSFLFFLITSSFTSQVYDVGGPTSFQLKYPLKSNFDLPIMMFNYLQVIKFSSGLKPKYILKI